MRYINIINNIKKKYYKNKNRNLIIKNKMAQPTFL